MKLSSVLLAHAFDEHGLHAMVLDEMPQDRKLLLLDLIDLVQERLVALVTPEVLRVEVPADVVVVADMDEGLGRVAWTRDFDLRDFW